MRILVKVDDQVVVVENVTIDNRCLPLVSGTPPYDSAAKDSSPLVRESAEWFKTLAVEAVYIDCNWRLVSWLPAHDTEIPDVQGRMLPGSQDFIPAAAKPLFEDTSIYDFDASLKEMMLKCSLATQNASRKLISTDEYHRIIAKIAHVYILPAIIFTTNDIDILVRVKSLIEQRLTHVEDAIRTKANVKENMKTCLNQMMQKLLCQENLDSESYLRTCDKSFLAAVLKVVECSIATLNAELSSVQNMVNWVKEQPGDGHRLAELKVRRDQIYADVDKQIQVRESIRNVVFRRNLSKRKNKKCQVTQSCLHNMFVDISQQLETQGKSMCELGDDKVSICAAREAVLYTLANVTDSGCHSGSLLQLQPLISTSFSLDDGNSFNKTSSWLPLQERVARVLRNQKSSASICHKHDCERLASLARLVLENFQKTGLEFSFIQPPRTEAQPCSHPAGLRTQLIQLAKVQPCDQCQETYSVEDCQFSLSLDEVTMRQPKLEKHTENKRHGVVIQADNHPWKSFFQHSFTDLCDVETANMTQSDTATHTADTTTHTPYSANTCKCEVQDDSRNKATSVWHDSGFVDINKVHEMETHTELCWTDDLADDYVLISSCEESRNHLVACSQNDSAVDQRWSQPRQLTLSVFMNAVDELKGQIQGHLTDIIEHLSQETLGSELDEMSLRERQELLWKSYDHFFCQKLYGQLLNLYKTGLTPGILQVCSELEKMSILDILKGDKLLDIFFDASIPRTRAISIPRAATNMSRVSLGGLSRDLNDIISGSENTEFRSKRDLVPRSESTSSVIQSVDEGFDQVSESLPSSLHSTFSIYSCDEDGDDTLDYDSRKMSDNLKLALSPFIEFVRVCLSVECFNDKIRYITKAIEGLNSNISCLFGPDFKSTCDDIISMLVLALCHIPGDMFVSLYINLRLLMDVLPSFFFGSRWDFNLVSLYSAYNYLFTLKISDHVIKKF